MLLTGLGLVVSAVFAVVQSRSNNEAAARQERQNLAVAEMQSKQNAVKIAVGVLSQKPPVKQDGTVQMFPKGEQALRKWAVSALNESSGQKIDDIEGDAREALITGASFLHHSRGYTTFETLDSGDGSPILTGDGQPLIIGHEQKSGAESK